MSSKAILNFSRFITYKEQAELVLYPYSNFKNNYEVEETIQLSKLIFLELKENVKNSLAELYIIYSGWVSCKKTNFPLNLTIKFLFESDVFFKK